VKNNDEGAFGEHSWTFRHPDFHAERPECLENIKRKVPTQRKSGASASASGAGGPKSASPAPGNNGGSGVGSGADEQQHSRVATLEAQVERLTAEQEHTAHRLREMRDRYEGTIAELVEWQRSMAQTDGIMRNLIQYFLQLENGASVAPAAVAPVAPGMFTPPYTR
jgi:osomolarity two-component system response regulator SKN7